MPAVTSNPMWLGREGGRQGGDKEEGEKMRGGVVTRVWCGWRMRRRSDREEEEEWGRSMSE